MPVVVSLLSINGNTDLKAQVIPDIPPINVVSASFDWSMPARFGLDPDNDGLILYHDTVAKVRPASFRVNFDACASEGSIAAYRWSIDGVFVQSSDSCSGFFQIFPTEGSHLVSLRVTPAFGLSSTVSHIVNVQDWLVLGLGDSYGSGEGNPDIPISVELFTQTQRALEDLEAAKVNLAQKIIDLGNAWNVLESIRETLSLAQQAVNRWNAQCWCGFGDCPTWDCPDATNDLTNTLISLGGQAAADLIAEGLEALQTFLNGLGEVAEAAYHLVETAKNTAQTAVTESQTVFDDLVQELQPVWQDRRCHRSAKSGQALAALRLEQQDPKTSVTFVHLACSGATVDEGIIGPYNGAEPPFTFPPSPLIPPQLERALALVGNREIDGLVMSIGGNNAGFGDIILTCMALEPCHQLPIVIDLGVQVTGDLLCSPLVVGPFAEDCSSFFDDLEDHDVLAAALFSEGIATLPGLYDQLDLEIQTTFPDLPSNRIFITEYPNGTRDENGHPCAFDLSDPLAVLPGFSLPEGMWAEQTVTIGLNDEVAAAAQEYDWNYVGGIFDAFDTHGYCSTSHWFVRLQEAFPRQGNEKGTMHPNNIGQYIYRNRIHTELRNSLYTGGDLSQPRPAVQPPVAIPRGAYTVNEGSSIQLINDSFDANGDAFTNAWTVDANPADGASLSDPNAVTPNLLGIDDATGEVTLTVTDNTGSNSNAATFTVANVSPSIGQAIGASVPEGSQATVQVSFSDPGTLDTHHAVIHWGDGSTTNLSHVSSPLSANHTFADNGFYDVEIIVTDDDGGSDSVITIVSVSNVSPAPSAGSAGGSEGAAVTLSVNVNDPGSGDTHSAEIHWGDGQTTNLPSVANAFNTNHIYQDEGNYLVLVTVTDDDGGSGDDSATLSIANIPPSVNVGGDAINEGAQAEVTVHFSDPGVLDTHTAVIHWGDGAETPLGSVTSPFTEHHLYIESGVYQVAVAVTDNDGDPGDDSGSVSVANLPPTVDLTTGTSDEGAPAAIEVVFSDPGILDTHSVQVNWGDGTSDTYLNASSPLAVAHTYVEDGNYSVLVTVTDDEGAAGGDAGTQVVLNTPAVVQTITGLEAPILIGTTMTAGAAFTDQGITDTHTASWDWGDGIVDPGVVSETNGSGTVQGTHTYSATGVYTVILTVTDDDGDSGQSVFQYAVVYDPAGGFVTGAGMINSPAGAYTLDPLLVGNAHFGFVSKYPRGGTIPIGETQFRFQAAGMRFESTSYQWLVVSVFKAQYKGSGQVNGAGDYGFLLSAIDGAVSGGGGVDKFRIKIWDKATGGIVYDNQLGAAADANPTTAVSAGNILIHK